MLKRQELLNFLQKEITEHLYVLKNEKVIFHAKGEIDKVSISETDMLRMKDNTILHNHPNGSPPSLADIINIINYDAKELVLVTSNHLFSVKKTNRKSNWGIVIEDFENDVKNCDQFANDEIQKLIIKGSISYDEANIEKNHYIWLILSDIYGFSYKRIEI